MPISAKRWPGRCDRWHVLKTQRSESIQCSHYPLLSHRATRLPRPVRDYSRMSTLASTCWNDARQTFDARVKSLSSFASFSAAPQTSLLADRTRTHPHHVQPLITPREVRVLSLKIDPPYPEDQSRDGTPTKDLPNPSRMYREKSPGCLATLQELDLMACGRDVDLRKRSLKRPDALWVYRAQDLGRRASGCASDSPRHRSPQGSLLNCAETKDV